MPTFGLARYQPRFVVDVHDIGEDTDPNGDNPYFWFARFGVGTAFSVRWPTVTTGGSKTLALSPIGVPKLRVR